MDQDKINGLAEDYAQKYLILKKANERYTKAKEEYYAAEDARHEVSKAATEAQQAFLLAVENSTTN